MNALKNTFLVLICAIVLVATGCKNPCKNFDCVNGTCSEDPDDRREAVCTCSTGYETENCSKGINAKLTGAYTLNETCSINTQPRSYEVVLTPKAGTTKEFIIAGLYNYGQQYTVVAVMGNAGTTFTVAKQASSQGGFDFQVDNGSLSADGKTLNLEYIVTFQDSIPVETCTATLTR